MTNFSRCAAGFLISWGVIGAVSASETLAPSLQAEVANESSSLSNGSPDWKETSLRLTRKLSQRSVRSIVLTQSSRFGLDDHEISGSASFPLSEKLTATLEASISPTHRVLAKQGLAASLQYEFLPAWIAHVGLGNRRYDTTNVEHGTLMLEHYFSSFSASAAWKPVRAAGVGSSSTELRGAYYYSDVNSVGIIYATGQEAITLAPNRVVLTDVRAVALLGRHWIDQQWALNYSWTHTRQGNFYTRKSVRLGVQYVF